MNTVSGAFLAALAAKGTILLALTALLALSAGRARASVRHALWTAGLTSLLLVPVLSIGLPRWEVITLPATALSGSRPEPIPAGATQPAPDAARDREPVAAPPNRTESIQTLTPASTTSGINLRISIPLLWLAGTGLMLSWLLLGHLRVRAMVGASNPELSPEWQASVAAALTLSPVSRGVRFRETRNAMPMVAGTLSPVILLPASGAGWAAQHRRDVVLHELAHVHRRDCLTHLGVQISCALHWFNPLAWLAARQARVEREHACDDAVLAAGALPSSYAQELLETARQVPAAWATAAAGLTMARPSHLANRLLAVLDQHRRRGRLGRAAFGAASLGTLAVLGPIAALAPATRERPTTTAEQPSFIPLTSGAGPAVPDPRRTRPLERPALGALASAPLQDPILCQYTKQGSHRTVHLTSSMSITGRGSADDGKGNAYVAWTGSDCSVVIHIVGEPVFSADESDITSFRDSGHLTFTHVQGNTERVYDVRGSGSSLNRSYRVEREERPIDQETRAWIRAMVLSYIRQSGYQAEARAERILKAQGIAGVLQEIETFQSDWAAARYYLVILTPAKDPEDIRRILDHAGARLESDYEKGRVLAAVPPRLLGNPAVRTAYLGATRGIESDYEKAKALVTVTGAGLDPASMHTALEAVGSIQSDYERARVLVAVSGTAPAGADLDPLYFDAARGIASDYEKSRVLSVYAGHAGLSEASLGRLYETAATITSANQLASLLLASISNPSGATARCEGYLTAASKIDGDYDKARALSSLLAAGPISTGCARHTAAVAGGITSDNQRAGVLIGFASKGLLTEATRVDFFQALGGVESAYERRRVLVAVLGQAPMNDAMMVSVLESAGGIDGDNDLASVLVAAAGTGKISEAVRPVYLRVTARLSSDYERRRALAAVGAR